MGSNQPENQNNIVGALTFPSQSEENAVTAAVQPRQPRNLQGLLRFAMEATKAEDAPGNSELGPIDEERRKFLEEALRSLTVDVAEVLRNAIKVLSNTEKIHAIHLGDPLPLDVQTAFDNLLEYIDDIDVANDFYKLGGFAIFPVCYGSDSDVVRALASTVLGEVCQNNSFCQARALDCGLVNVLLNLIESEKDNALAKALFALSCAVREFGPAAREVLQQGSAGVLTQHMRETHAAVRGKAVRLAITLATHHAVARKQFLEQGVINVIAEQLKKDRDETHEHFIRLLLILIEGMDPTKMREQLVPSLGLRETILNNLKHPDLVDDTFLEEKEYYNEVLTHLEPLASMQDSGEDADR